MSIFLGVCGLMLLMLLLQLALGTPLERRASHGVAEAIRENPEDAMLFAAGFSAGKTPWYWVAIFAVLLAASGEVVAWLLGRARFHKTPVSVPGILGASFAAACVTALLLQYGLWEAGLMALEAQAAKIRQAEEERVAREEAERLRERAQIEREREDRELRERQQEEARKAQVAREKEQQEAQQAREKAEQERAAYEARKQRRQEQEAREKARQEEAAREKAARDERLAQEKPDHAGVWGGAV